MGLFTAQSRDDAAGSLHAHGATGGPAALSQQPFFLGINDPLGGNPTGAPFDARAFGLFDSWMKSTHSDDDGRADARAAIARGQALFNTRPITITGVAGLNDNPAVGASFSGTCTTCHDTPNSGNHSVSAPLNLGLTDVSRRTRDLPLYTLRNRVTGDQMMTSDPGRAMISGKWKDVGKFKGPILRGLAARAPYFHNGSAATVGDAVEFYNTRFQLNFRSREKSDLIAFLLAL
jgi:cytochrome c peroxidase